MTTTQQVLDTFDSSQVTDQLVDSRPDNLWLFFANQDDRDRAARELRGSWAELEDRSVQLNYVHTWTDVNGWALHATNASAWPALHPVATR